MTDLPNTPPPSEERTEPLPPPSPAPRKLMRSGSDRVLAGVSGGLGRHFELDPLLFRIGFVLLTLFGGSGVLLYILLAILVPSDGEQPAPGASQRGRGLVIAGVVVLAIISIPFAGFGLAFLGPGLLTIAVLVAVGVLIWRAAGGGGAESDQVTRVAVIVLAIAAAIVVGIGAAAAAAFGGGTVVAILVIVAGVILVVAAFAGGARWLIVPALLLALPLAVVSASGLDLDGGVGEREYRPASIADLKPEYRLGVGEMRLDLRDIDFPEESRTDLDVSMGMGRIEIAVPDGVCVTSNAHIGVGHADVFERENAGVDVDAEFVTDRTGGSPVLHVDADIGMGELEIDRHGFLDVDGGWRGPSDETFQGLPDEAACD